MKHYMDLFDTSALPAASRRTVAGSVVPELIEAIHRHNLVPRLGHDLGTVADIQRRNASRMRLFRPFNPEFQDHDESNTVVMTIERDGEPVACAGTRLLWIDGSLGDAFQSLRIDYSDAGATAGRGEACVCTAPTAWSIADCPIGLTGAVFVQQGEPPQVLRTMMRLLHLWVFVHWRWSWLISLAQEPHVRADANDVYGFPITETGVARCGHWYWLLLAPRSFYRATVTGSSFRSLDMPLCLPSEAAIRRAGGDPSGFRFSGAAE